MNLPLHQILPGEPVALYAQHIDDSGAILASCRIPSQSTQQSQQTQLRIHSLYPLSKLRISERCPPNVSSVHPYGTSNLLFLVLGKDNRKGKASANNTDTGSYKIALWDDKKEEVLLELLFREPVIDLVSRRDKLVVVLERRAVLFHLDFDSQDRAEAVLREGEYETVSNPSGLVSLSTAAGSTLLALPGRQVGHVQLIRLPRLQALSEVPRPGARMNARAAASTPPPYPIVHIFLAHSSPLRTLTLSNTGNLLCTSSNKGTLLRVFSTSNKALIRELRRGTDQADIWSVAFLHPDRGEMVACASDKRTVHVWKVGDLSIPSSSSTATTSPSPALSHSSPPSSSSKVKDTAKAFNLLKPYLPAYFSSQWSDMTWRIPHNASVTFQPSHVAALAEQDDVATCFFVYSAAAREADMASSRSQKARRRKSSNKDEEDPFYLIVITRSGAWYKLSLSSGPSTTGSTQTRTAGPSSETRTRRVSIQDERENISPTSRSRKASSASTKTSETNKVTDEDEKKCRLVEYKRIGYGTDGEEDEEEFGIEDVFTDSDDDE